VSFYAKFSVLLHIKAVCFKTNATASFWLHTKCLWSTVASAPTKAYNCLKFPL